MSLQANDPKLMRRLAFDTANLRRPAEVVEEPDDVAVRKEVLSESMTPARRLEIVCAVPGPTGLRVDRLLAIGLQLSRRRVRRLQEAGDVAVSPEGSRPLRMAVRDGMRVTIELSRAHDRDGIAMAARSSD